ncbi:hypothetical protein LOZ51_002039 [Ophidiomyces ophidiicola]|nr:hypothetical protein LOZ55_001795 [Ophidiomyces ophidiicola]KAI1993768.1 hypothetical protein LOZ54_001273 [Ophidiomyces ophidiicola]KAI1999548.1 hypothetical protein LOZ51_002039 [Ophidiomyces ophidiicola]
MQSVRLSLRQIHQRRLRASFCHPCSRLIREFQTSQSLRISHGEPHGLPSSATEDNVSRSAPEPNTTTDTQHAAPAGLTEPQVRSGSTKADSRRDSRPYGSALRRSMRNKISPERSAPAVIPSWFQKRNIILSNSSLEALQALPHIVGIGQSKQDADDIQEVTQGGEGGDAGDGKPPNGSTPEYRYMISEEVWNEIRTAIQAGMTLPAPHYADDPSARKVHLVLQYPGDGGILFLDAVVKKAAASFGAHMITLDAQDIAELHAQQEKDEGSPEGLMSSLGYEVYRPTRKASSQGAEEEAEELDEGEEESESQEQKRSFTLPVSKLSDPGALGSSILEGLFGGKATIGVAKMVAPQGRGGRSVEDEADSESLRVVSKLLSIPKETPDTSVTGNILEQSGEEHQKSNSSKDLIIQIQDYNDLLNTAGGSVFLTSLHKAIQVRRRKGQRIIVIGTVSSSEIDRSSGKTFPKLIPRDYDRFSTTIFVTPSMDSKNAEKKFAEDSRERILGINIRHMQNMLKTRLREPMTLEHSFLSHQKWPLESSMIRSCGLDAGYWPFDLVHRIATLTLGSAERAENLELRHVQQAIEVFEKSDRVKCEWMGEKHTAVKLGKQAQSKPRLDKSRLKCNSHEEKLLNGVVDAESIRTTFADVHVPKETVEALKTLTSLSLVRPDAFTYGVLSTDKIPGLLLYGPPGTGKTLLAKAVARESGATVLEVSGSEVYDMFVGEGEKNVKAIFTLAKKLSPCVVFIDEADAIFCSRTGASNRTSHRELINQFLREWDGMSETSAFIMVATNRPFDLDDAVLRRLPRRLLVDLPTEQDRHAILKIHLKGEALDDAVDLADIAHRTPFYSGSDLKNMSVAAALACVREEYDAAGNHKGEEPYQYPERRTLRPHHFDRAMEEISASISEDMSSLTAIRKFDEKYGDRKGRRKKTAGWGFHPPGVPENTLDTGRVRH